MPVAQCIFPDTHLRLIQFTLQNIVKTVSISLKTCYQACHSQRKKKSSIWEHFIHSINVDATQAVEMCNANLQKINVLREGWVLEMITWKVIRYDALARRQPLTPAALEIEVMIPGAFERTPLSKAAISSPRSSWVRKEMKNEVHMGVLLYWQWLAKQAFTLASIDLLPDMWYCWLRMHRECQERFPHQRLQRKSLVSGPDMHQGTCVTHVPWCMSWSLTRGGGENAPDIPGAFVTRNFTYLARGPLGLMLAHWWLVTRCFSPKCTFADMLAGQGTLINTHGQQCT